MEERLKKFVRLIDAGNFTKASHELHISQPALTVAIHKLERELHATLLVRDTRSLHITPAGKIAYEAGKELLIRTHNLTTRLAELSNVQLSIAIGMIDSVAQTFFMTAEPMSRLEEQAKAAIIVNNSRILQQAVTHDELDIAFVTEQPHHEPSIIDTHYVATEPLVVVCHAEQQALIQEAVKNGQLPHFMSYDQPSNSHRMIEQTLAARGIQVTPTFYSTSPEVMLRLAVLQKGIAALPYLLVKPYLTAGTLVIIRQGDPIIIDRRIEAIIRHDRVFTTPYRHIIDQVKNLVTQLYDEATTLP